MKISILGSGSIGLSGALLATLNGHKHDVTVIDSVDDVNPDDCDVLICDDESEALVFCGHPLGNLGIECFPSEISIPTKDDSFRGGARGKGGKIKYERR